MLKYFSDFHKNLLKKKKKHNDIPVTGRGGPYGCEISRLAYFLDNRITDGGEGVRITLLPPFAPTNISGTHFC
jgi:hypothetical protein